jgi:endonuclease YncB( thermonuclease family)
VDRPDHLGKPVTRPLWALLVVFAYLGPAAAGDGGDVRNVTPPGFTRPPAADGPLERIPAPPRPPEEPKWWRLVLPETDDPATFRANGRTVHVADVVPVAPDAVCARADGTAWPCGRTALYSLRRFLHGRPVQCFFTLGSAPPEFSAPCRVGTTDVATWLLAQGWAEPDETAADEYRQLAQVARCTRRGRWQGTDPPADCQSTE